MENIRGFVGSTLLVEDSAVELDLAMRAFGRRKLFNPLQVARNADEVMALMREWENGEPVPALILLDVHLPGVGGLELLRRLKSHKEFKAIPVIMLTSSGKEQDIHEAYHLGANSYIVKPVDFGRFMELAAQLDAYWCRLNTPPK